MTGLNTENNMITREMRGNHESRSYIEDNRLDKVFSIKLRRKLMLRLRQVTCCVNESPKRLSHSVKGCFCGIACCKSLMIYVQKKRACSKIHLYQPTQWQSGLTSNQVAFMNSYGPKPDATQPTLRCTRKAQTGMYPAHLSIEPLLHTEPEVTCGKLVTRDKCCSAGPVVFFPVRPFGP